jgi:hypothetical protein
MVENSSCKFDLPRHIKKNTSRANTIGVVIVLSYFPKFAALRLFIETIRIYKAVATGKGNN